VQKVRSELCAEVGAELGLESLERLFSKKEVLSVTWLQNCLGSGQVSDDRERFRIPVHSYI